MESIKFGILGCGTIGAVHAKAIIETEGAKLISVCDSDKERRERYSADFSAKPVQDYEEMLRDPEIDAVSICTPSGMHKDQAIAALRHGKHVILEKPMALTAEDAKEVCYEAKKSGKQLSIVFQMRFEKDIQYIKKVIDEGLLGRLTFLDIYMKYWRDPSYFTASPWRGTFAMDGGGALMNQGIHGIDIIHYLFGKPKLLGARVKTLVHNIETEDTAAALVEYPSGALGVIEASTSSNPGFNRKIEINGSRGYAIIVDAMIEKLYIDGKLVIDKKIKDAKGTSSDPAKMSHERHALLYKNFIGAISEGEPLLSSAEDGYNAVNFIEEIYKMSNCMI